MKKLTLEERDIYGHLSTLKTLSSFDLTSFSWSFLDERSVRFMDFFFL